LNGGSLETGANITNVLGTAAGQVQLPGGASGFSAFGAPVIVNIGGAAAQLTWGGATFNPTSLILNAASANNTLEFQNPLNLAAATRTVVVDANTATITGVISTASGTAGLTKNGAGTLVLTAANTYNGTTTLGGGTLTLSGGNDRIAAGTALSMTGTSTLNLGGNSQTFGAYTAPNVGSTQTATFTNGNITFNGGTTALTFTNSTADAISNIDMKGLSSFTFNQATKNFQVNAGYTGNTNGDQTTVDVSLPGTGATNSITALTVDIGTIGPQSAVSTGNTSRLHLGQTNTINTDTLNIATTGRNNSTLDYQTGLTSPQTTIRGTAGGSSRVGTVTVSSHSSGGTNLTGNLDFSLGSVDARFGNVRLGDYAQPNSSGGTTTANLKIAAGTIDATSIVMSNQSVAPVTPTATPTINSIITQSGGSVIVGSLRFGQYAGGGTSTTLNPSYILSGGTLSAQTIDAGAGGNTASVRKIDWSGGTIQNFNDGVNPTQDLNISGAGSAASEVLSINLLTTGANSHTFQADTGRTITVQSTAVLKGTGGGIIKNGAGTLNLAGANTYTGNTVVNTGTLLVTNTSGSATGTGVVSVNASGALGGNGIITSAVNFVGGGELKPGTSPGTLSTGALSLDSATLLTYEFGTAGVPGGLDNDLTVVTGNLVLDGTINVLDSGTFGIGTYRVFNYSGTLTDNILDVGTLPSGYAATVDTSTANQVNLIVTVIPEPSTIVLGGLALLGLAGYQLRRRRLA
jgi:fibronectin-binding autotransporter adhesin